MDNIDKKILHILQGYGRITEVLECYHITGEEDYLLKVCVQDIPAYSDFL